MFKGEIAGLLSKHVKLKKEEIEDSIEIPPDSKLGDYAFPCFNLSKELKKSPANIAKDLSGKIKASGIILEVKNVGPYVNFFVKPEVLIDACFEYKKPKKHNKTIVLEYSSPNIAKPFGVGHLRSTLVGSSLKRIYEYCGWKTVSLNHLGDWGTQFGNLITAYKKWPVDLKEDPIRKLFEIYVKFNAEGEKKEELKEEGRNWFKKLEKGDKEAEKLWKNFRDISLKEFQKIYTKLGVTFDDYVGESFYKDKMQPVVKELEEKNLLEESDGAMIVDLSEYKMAPLIALKKDGATTYLTRDLATAIYRKKKYNFDKMIYEVGSEQQLHFQQLFKVLELMGKKWSKDCTHVMHGLYKFKDKKMSTRKGNTIFVEDLIEEAKQKILKMIAEKNPDLKNKEEVAEKAGVGAIIFNDLKNDRVKGVNFSWEETLNFEGDSGVYLQYTHARLSSILRKSDQKPKKISKLLQETEESEVAKHLLEFNNALFKSVEQNKPHILARWLLDLAQIFNTYYQKHKIIQDNKKLESARLSLLSEVKDKLRLGLNLLGITAPEEM